MTTVRSQMRSAYMEFAKLRSGARFNLASSGIENFPMAELPFRAEDLQLTGTGTYGYEPLQERLAAHCEVSQECIVQAMGTSLANHLTLAATADPGDEILVEDPTYELITSTAQFLGLEVRTFPRRFEDQYRIDPQEVAKRITAKTRLVVAGIASANSGLPAARCTAPDRRGLSGSGLRAGGALRIPSGAGNGGGDQQPDQSLWP